MTNLKQTWLRMESATDCTLVSKEPPPPLRPPTSFIPPLETERKKIKDLKTAGADARRSDGNI